MITAREIYGYGLITGMTCADMRQQKPGFILDMISIRQSYLSKIFGGKKKTDNSL